MTRAAFLSARNDVLANAAIILAGLVTAYTVSAWPDLIVGLGIFLMNLDAAREVYVAARKERAELRPRGAASFHDGNRAEHKEASMRDRRR